MNKNLPVAEIKAQIQTVKGVPTEDKSSTVITVTTPELQLKKGLEDFKKVVMSNAKKVSQLDAITVLQDCIKKIQADIKAESTETIDSSEVQE